MVTPINIVRLELDLNSLADLRLSLLSNCCVLTRMVGDFYKICDTKKPSHSNSAKLLIHLVEDKDLGKSSLSFSEQDGNILRYGLPCRRTRFDARNALNRRRCNSITTAFLNLQSAISIPFRVRVALRRRVLFTVK